MIHLRVMTPLRHLLGVFLVVFVKNVGSSGIDFVKLVQLGARLFRGAEDVSLEEPRHRLGDLMVHVRLGRHRKDIVEFFERSLLG